MAGTTTIQPAQNSIGCLGVGGVETSVGALVQRRLVAFTLKMTQPNRPGTAAIFGSAHRGTTRIVEIAAENVCLPAVPVGVAHRPPNTAYCYLYPSVRISAG